MQMWCSYCVEMQSVGCDVGVLCMILSPTLFMRHDFVTHYVNYF